MKEYIERDALIQQMADNFRQGVWGGCDCGEYQIAEDTILCAPAADVVEVKRGRCKFCGGEDNAFHIINAETVAYSGIEIAINRLGILRVRVYDDYECETALPRSSEIVMIAACPNCGADMR
jgi:hypothetical protein